MHVGGKKASHGHFSSNFNLTGLSRFLKQLELIGFLLNEKNIQVLQCHISDGKRAKNNTQTMPFELNRRSMCFSLKSVIHSSQYNTPTNKQENYFLFRTVTYYKPTAFQASLKAFKNHSYNQNG